MKTAILSVTNDLSTDQRVHRTALALQKLNYQVTLVGRKRKNSISLSVRNYQTHRMNLLFDKGFLFYAEFNLRLFFYLLFHSTDLLVANDLDTLLPNYLVSRIQRKKLVYDSHEYFTGVPELENRKFVQSVWKTIERWIFPKLHCVFTVNESIASLYRQEYNVGVKVIRNIPIRHLSFPKADRNQFNIPIDKKIVLYQGGGINVDRGMEEAVQAMQYVGNAIFLIVGDGDVIGKLKEMVAALQLSDKVFFIPKLPFEELRKLTVIADIALSLDKDTNINYRYSLPNKLFDYIHATVPVLVTPLVEVKKIIDEYQVGTFIENHTPKHIGEKINQLLQNEQQLGIWKENCYKAAQELCWEKEEEKLITSLLVK